MSKRLSADETNKPIVSGRISFNTSNPQPSDSVFYVLHDEISTKTMGVLRHPNFFKILFTTLWLIYVVAACIHDISQAIFIYSSTLFFVACYGIRYLTKLPEFRQLVVNAEIFTAESLAQPSLYYAFVILLIAVFGGITTYCVYNEPRRIISLLGLVVFISSAYLFSWKRKDVKWRPVVWGFALQFIFALIILRTTPGYDAFNFIGQQMTYLLAYTTEGSKFVFGYLATGAPQFYDVSHLEEWKFMSYGIFAFQIVPTVIFFSSLASIMYYLNVLQVLVYVIGGTMSYCLGTSMSESFNAAGNIFVGLTEAPLLIRPFLKDMTKSELHAVMTGGFATIAGGVMAIYISMGIPASHLIAASVMGAPSALAISKLVYPETEESKSAFGKSFVIEKGSESNVIEAASNGASIAVQLAGNIVGMLIAFIALIAMLDAWVGYFGSRIGWEDASFQTICGYLFYPIAWVMGVPHEDCEKIARLIGLKIVANEFLAYKQLESMINEGLLQDRSILIGTYALCGFSNFASIGIQLGGLVPLAPTRSKDLAKLVLSAMISGNLACFMTACIAGLVAK